MLVAYSPTAHDAGLIFCFNCNTALHQDSSGFIWIGTNEGLSMDQKPKVEDLRVATVEVALFKDIPATTSTNIDLPLALIVEDNADVVQYLIFCLDKNYRIEVAKDGQQDIETALEITPDIIINDVMMPKKDGFELTQTLKTDIRTSHVPTILLTVKADITSKITGLTRGGDAYLPKPFNRQELLVRM